METGRKEETVLTLSVAVCTRNRPHDLLKTLQTVMRQTLLPMEILIVDDGELEPSVYEDLRRQQNVKFGYIRKKKRGLTRSRNVAIDNTKGDILTFLDDDVELEPECLERIHRVFADDSDGRIGGVSGLVVNAPQAFLGRGFWTVFQGGIDKAGGAIQWTPLGPRVVRPLRSREDVECFGGANMSYRREVFDRFRFDENLDGYGLGEDADFSYRVGREYRLVLEPRARLLHNVSSASRTKGFLLGRMETGHRRYLWNKNRPRTLRNSLILQWGLLGVFTSNMVTIRRRGVREYWATLLGNLAGLFWIPGNDDRRKQDGRGKS